jgi:hypothetical protein
MTDDKFTELVNLYFDSEISSVDSKWLQDELSSNPARKREFEERHHLHQAMRMALNQSACAPRSAATQPSPMAIRLPVWILASGLAACFSIGFVVLTPVLLEDSARMMARSVNMEIVGEDELPELGQVEMARYTAIQQQAERSRGSLTAQLRLLGLHPEMTPQERQLQGVDMAALSSRNESASREVDLLNQISAESALDRPQLFEALNRPIREEHNASRWPSGFGSSLASFK